MKTLSLSVLDRCKLTELLPLNGGKVEMLLVQSIMKKAEFSLEDIAEFGMKDTVNGVAWTNGKDVDFEFTLEQIEVLKAASKRADEEKKITRENLPLIEKIDML